MTKSALITGASGGIGQILCESFRAAGYFVLATDLSESHRNYDAFVQADLDAFSRDSSYRQEILERTRDHLGSDGLSVLINNAAIQILGSLEQVSDEDWQRTLNVNLIAPFLWAKNLLSELERAKGSVINMGSVHSVLTKPRFVCYATSKAAIVGLTRSMAVDLGSRIRVNVINAAATQTPMLKAGFEGDTKGLEELANMHPLGRIADPAEIARVALFLASSEASFMSGSVVTVDGGISSRLHDPE